MKLMKDDQENSNESQEKIGDYSNLKKEINDVLNICRGIINSTGGTEKRKQSGDGQKSTKQKEEQEKSQEITLEKVAQDISAILKDLKDHLDTFSAKSDSFSDVIPKLERSFQVENKKGFFKQMYQNLDPAYNPQNYENYNLPQAVKSMNSNNQNRPNNPSSFKRNVPMTNSTNNYVVTRANVDANVNQDKAKPINNNLMRAEDIHGKIPNVTDGSNRVIPTPKSSVDNGAVPISQPAVHNNCVSSKSTDNKSLMATSRKLTDQSSQVVQCTELADGTRPNFTNQEKVNLKKNYPIESESGKTKLLREQFFLNNLMVPRPPSGKYKDQVKLTPTYNTPKPLMRLFPNTKDMCNLSNVTPSTTKPVEKAIENELSKVMSDICSFHEYIMLDLNATEENKSTDSASISQESTDSTLATDAVETENNPMNNPSYVVSMPSAVEGNLTDGSQSMNIEEIKTSLDRRCMHGRNIFLEARHKFVADENSPNSLFRKSLPDSVNSKNHNISPDSAKRSLKSDFDKAKSLKSNITDIISKTAQLVRKTSATYRGDHVYVSSVGNVKKPNTLKSKPAKASSGNDVNLKSRVIDVKPNSFKINLNVKNSPTTDKNLPIKTVENSKATTKAKATLKNTATDRNSKLKFKIIAEDKQLTSNSHSSSNTVGEAKRAKTASGTKTKGKKYPVKKTR